MSWDEESEEGEEGGISITKASIVARYALLRGRNADSIFAWLRMCGVPFEDLLGRLGFSKRELLNMFTLEQLHGVLPGSFPLEAEIEPDDPDDAPPAPRM